MPDTGWTVHVVPQFHLDLAWTWRWRETLPMVENSMVGNVQQLQAHPEATFALSQIMLLDHVRRLYPTVFEGIRQLHAAGRWENVGGMWVESDLNIPSGESLARQFLYGQRLLLEHFGEIATCAWAPDCFGHSGNLPQLFRLAGIEHYILKRPRDINIKLPNVPFDWEGIDGTKLLSLRVVNKGNGQPSAPSQGTEFQGDPVEYIKEIFADRGLSDLWGPIGVGDVGGVNRYEIPGDTDDTRYRFSTPARFFEAIAADELPGRPVHSGELNPFFDGAYTTQMDCKKGNRETESTLVHTEAMAALAGRAGLPYPREQLGDLWKRLLFTQFHDILPGTGEKPTHQDAVHDFEEIRLRCEEIQQSAAWHTTRPGAGVQEAPGVVVTNSLGSCRTDVVECLVGGQHLLDGWDAVAPDGTRSPVQVLHHRTNWSHSWQTIAFIAHDMPALGYRFYRFEPPARAETPHQYWGATGHTFTGRKLRAVIDPSIGGLASVVDLDSGISAIRRDCRALFEVWEQGEYGLDYGMEHKAWWLGLTGEHRRIREISALAQLTEQGPVRMSLRVCHEAGDSRFTQDFIIYRDLARVDVDVTVDFHEIEKTIRLAFPADVGDGAISLHSIPFGAIERPQDGREYPMQNWAALCDDSGGIAVLNNGRYGVSSEDDVLRMTVVRNSTYPDIRSDHGVHRFRYAVLPVTRATVDRAVIEGAAINRPLRGHFLHSAPVASEGALLPGLDLPPNVELSCAKLAEEGDQVILRVFESIGRETPLTCIDGAQPVDLIEREMDECSETLRPFEIRSLRVDR